MDRPEPREPLFFQRKAKTAVWGGTALAQRLGVAHPSGSPIGETWELSDYPGEETAIVGGGWAGRSLQDVLAEHHNALMGESRLDPAGRFPLLVKFIDAKGDLSVQVHPPDGPSSPTGVGKTEAWYVLEESSADAAVIAGLRPGTSPARMQAEAADKRVLDHLLQHPVRGGDCLLIEAGTAHAIRAGAVLCEVQQTSDVTYRMYDWGRLGLNQEPRPLHLPEALSVLDYQAPPPAVVRAAFPPPPAGRIATAQVAALVSCPYFRLHLVRLNAEADHEPQGFARVLVVVRGSGRLHSAAGGTRALKFADTVLLPARMGGLSVTPDAIGMELLEAVAL